MDRMFNFGNVYTDEIVMCMDQLSESGFTRLGDDRNENPVHPLIL